MKFLSMPVGVWLSLFRNEKNSFPMLLPAHVWNSCLLIYAYIYSLLSSFSCAILSYHVFHLSCSISCEKKKKKKQKSCRKFVWLFASWQFSIGVKCLACLLIRTPQNRGQVLRVNGEWLVWWLSCRLRRVYFLFFICFFCLIVAGFRTIISRPLDAASLLFAFAPLTTHIIWVLLKYISRDSTVAPWYIYVHEY